MGNKQKLELTWIGKGERPRLEPRVLRIRNLGEFEKYRLVQDLIFESDFDKVMKQIESSGPKGSEK